MFTKIIVPLDGSSLAECVFPHLETVIKGYNSVEVTFVRVVEPITIPYGREAAAVTSIGELNALETHNRTDAEKYLKGIVARFRKAGVNARMEVIYGKAADALADFVTKSDAGLVIIATHGRSGISRYVWGSTADRLLRTVCVPILMVRAPGCGLGISAEAANNA